MASVLLPRDSEPGPETGICAIVVLYGDNSSRDAAIRLCNSLEQIFDSELDFEITWCRFRYFNDSTVASEAAEIAARADLVIVSVQDDHDLPLEVKAWFERWLPERDHSEGALVLLQSSASARRESAATSRRSYLYLLAQRANLDYLSLSDASTSALAEHTPQNLIIPPPLDLDSVRNSSHHSHSGINE